MGINQYSGEYTCIAQGPDKDRHCHQLRSVWSVIVATLWPRVIALCSLSSATVNMVSYHCHTVAKS